MKIWSGLVFDYGAQHVRLHGQLAWSDSLAMSFVCNKEVTDGVSSPRPGADNAPGPAKPRMHVMVKAEQEDEDEPRDGAALHSAGRQGLVGKNLKFIEISGYQGPVN